MSRPRDVALASAFADAAQDPDWDVRESALYTLRFFDVDPARTALMAAAQDPELDPALRGVATESLAGTGGGASVERTLLSLLADPLPELRFWAAHGLGGVGGASAIAALETLLAQPDVAVAPYGTLHQEARAAIDAIRSRRLASRARVREDLPMPADSDGTQGRLELELQVPSRPVPIGDEVMLTVALINRDAVPILVNRRLLPTPRGGPRALGEIRVEVSGPAGYVNRKAAHVNAGRPRAEDFAELAPDAAVERSFPLTRFHSLHIPGEYSVRVSYANAATPEGLDGRPWTGEIESEWQAIERVEGARA